MSDAIAKSIILWYITNPYAIGGTVAIGYGLYNPSTRGWTYRMCMAYGRNSALFAARMVKDSTIITWSETVGLQGAKRRAGKRAVAKAAQRKALLRTTSKGVGKRALARGVASRAIPLVGWGILAYDIIDYAHGDDQSFIGDIVTVLTD